MPWACTINEPQIVAREGYLKGHFPPGLTNPVLWKQVTRTFIAAHAAAVRALGAGAGDPKAGICLQLPDLEPARPGDGDCEAFVPELRYEMGEIYVKDLPGAFVGVQYYTRERLDPALPGLGAPAPEDVTLTQMGWELNPDGLNRAIRLAASSGLPVVITENGIATADDRERIAYLRDHLAVVAAAHPRRDRHPRLHVLVGVRQLRVERGLPPAVRDGRRSTGKTTFAASRSRARVLMESSRELARSACSRRPPAGK